MNCLTEGKDDKVIHSFCFVLTTQSDEKRQSKTSYRRNDYDLSTEHPVEWARDFIFINYFKVIHLYFIHVLYFRAESLDRDHFPSESFHSLCRAH